MSDVKVVGQLEPAEKETLDRFKKIASDIVSEIGQMEVRKARLLGTISDIEAKGQALMAGVEARLEIPKNTAWSITAEGDVIIK